MADRTPAPVPPAALFGAVEAPEPREQVRAVAEHVLDTLAKIAAWGLHDSNLPELRAYVAASREALKVAADPYDPGVAAGRTAAAADPMAILRWLQEHHDAFPVEFEEARYAIADPIAEVRCAIEEGYPMPWTAKGVGGPPATEESDR